MAFVTEPFSVKRNNLQFKCDFLVAFNLHVEMSLNVVPFTFNVTPLATISSFN